MRPRIDTTCKDTFLERIGEQRRRTPCVSPTTSAKSFGSAFAHRVGEPSNREYTTAAPAPQAEDAGIPF